MPPPPPPPPGPIAAAFAIAAANPVATKVVVSGLLGGIANLVLLAKQFNETEDPALLDDLLEKSMAEFQESMTILRTHQPGRLERKAAYEKFKRGEGPNPYEGGTT